MFLNITTTLRKQHLHNRVIRMFDLSRRAFGDYKIEIVFLTVLGLLSGLVEGIGINALVPLLTLTIGTATDAPTDFITQVIERFFVFFNIGFTVKNLLIFISLLFMGKAAATIFLGLLKIRITADYAVRTRSSLFDSILRSNWPHLLKQHLGHLETNLLIDVPGSTKLLREISTMIMLVTGMFVYLLVAINISIEVTLITLALGGFIFLLFKPLVYKVRQLGHKLINTNKKIAHIVSENIYGIKTIKATLVHTQISEKAYRFFWKLREIEIKSSFYNLMPASFIPMIGVLYIVTIFFIFYNSEELNFLALPVIVYVIHRMFSYIQQMQRSVQLMNAFAPHTRSVLRTLEDAEQHVENSLKGKKFTFNTQLSFKDVSFSYDDSKQVLRHVSFDLPKGSMTGIIGPSGSGKTTLVDLILRLQNVRKGSIKIDSQNIQTISLSEWRSHIGYVSQDMFLMNDTIASNIRFYKHDISDKEVSEAAEDAHVTEFTSNLPEGLDTFIGERGVKLSAGQRQRIVIARALIRKPDILILDEATSALDNESEVQIQKVINKLKGTITVLVIAHRLTTIEESDHLIVIDNGTIKEMGSPDTLLKDKGSYFYKVYTIRE